MLDLLILQVKFLLAYEVFVLFLNCIYLTIRFSDFVIYSSLFSFELSQLVLQLLLVNFEALVSALKSLELLCELFLRFFFLIQ